MELPRSGQGWSVENTRPSWQLRIRTIAAYDVYRAADRLYRRHRSARAKLEGVQETLVSNYYIERMQRGDHGPDSTADPEFVAMLDQFSRISWQLHDRAGRANAAASIANAACDEVRNVLREIGYKELPEGKEEARWSSP